MLTVIRKSADENVMIVQRPSGFAVNVRREAWHQVRSHYFAESCRGVMVQEWQTIGKGLTAEDADDLFARLTGTVEKVVDRIVYIP